MNLRLHYSINFESGDSTDGIEYEAGIPDEFRPEDYYIVSVAFDD